MAATTTKRTISKPTQGPGKIRGVTRAQYLTLRRMVRDGDTTWEELEQQGIVLPPQRESDFRRQVLSKIKNK